MSRTMIRGIAVGIVAATAVVAIGIAGAAAADGKATATTPTPTAAVAPVVAPRALPPVTAVQIDLRASRSAVRLPLQLPPRTLARLLVTRMGWDGAQWTCLDTLWTRESHWNAHAVNARSGAYGIPQALPGWKMSIVAPDWREDALTQIRWGLWYIAQRYGTPCAALQQSNLHGYY